LLLGEVEETTMKNFVQTGDNLAFLASELTGPTHSHPDTYQTEVAAGEGVSAVATIEAGDPVVVGRLCGVANTDAIQTTDTVIVSTRGVYNLAVVSQQHTGITKGETVYIDPTTAILSDTDTGVPFGIALGTVALGNTTTIPVKLLQGTAGAAGANS